MYINNNDNWKIEIMVASHIYLMYFVNIDAKKTIHILISNNVLIWKYSTLNLQKYDIPEKLSSEGFKRFSCLETGPAKEERLTLQSRWNFFQEVLVHTAY